MKNFKWPIIFLVLVPVCVVLHNLFYALTKIEEPVFFLLTFIFALAFIISLIILIIKKFK